ncbi:MAG: polysaccharide export protein [Alphaproteobacteria bacterium]|jgi:protein involved in polysaccharide export with SLBB domain|nr:polysaccharide export protein [Alphaproteobacteria bacterium]
MWNDLVGVIRRAPALLVLVLCVLLTACGGGLPSEMAPAKATLPGDGYLLEPGNRVRVIVFNEPALSGDFTVDASGNIAVPLAGGIPSSGVTAKVLAKRIEDALIRGGFLKEPQVSVEIQTFRPYYVLGEVRQPGEFPYTTGVTVLGAIARAGGYDYRAREGEVLLVRDVDGQPKEFRANERTQLQPGDIVKVQQRAY